MPMTIGQAAARSRCSAPTIRYYEDIGLLAEVGRSANGRRAFSWPQVHRLTFIRRARDLGLSIEAVRNLLAASGDGANCGQARDLITGHVATIQRKRAELERLEATLTQMAQRCDSTCATDPSAVCTVFEDLAAPHAGAGA